jgi:hypothetical protein
MRKHVGNALAALVCSAGVFGISGCSGEGSDNNGPDGAPQSTADARPATEICDGTLAGPAAGSLEDLSGQRTFTEGEGLRPADLGDFASSLKRPDAFRETLCNIYTPVHGPNPFARVDFRWSTPDSRSDSASADSEDGKTYYATGETAYADEDAAIIRFPCPIREASPEESLVSYLFVLQSAAAERKTVDMMSIVNSMSRAVAEELGCLDGSRLVEGEPQRLQ